MISLAEGTNGTDADTVAFGICHGEAFRIEPDLAIEGISDLQHKLGLFNAAAGDHAFFLRQFLAGMDRILKRIGYDRTATLELVTGYINEPRMYAKRAIDNVRGMMAQVGL